MKKLKERAEKVRLWLARTVLPALFRAGKYTAALYRKLDGMFHRLRQSRGWMALRRTKLLGIACNILLVMGIAGFFLSMKANSQHAPEERHMRKEVVKAEASKAPLPPMAERVEEPPPALPQPEKLVGRVGEPLPPGTYALAVLPPPRPLVQVRPEADDARPLTQRKVEKPEPAGGSRFMRLPGTNERVEYYPSRRNRERMKQLSERQEEAREAPPRRKYQRLRRVSRPAEPNPHAVRDAYLASRTGGNN